MSRFTLTPDASRDLDEIILYLNSLPERPALKIGRALRFMLQSIATRPRIGRFHADYSASRSCEVRSRICWPYLLYYEVPSNAPHEIPQLLAIIDGRRDVAAILSQRLK